MRAAITKASLLSIFVLLTLLIMLLSTETGGATETGRAVVESKPALVESKAKPEGNQTGKLIRNTPLAPTAGEPSPYIVLTSGPLSGEVGGEPFKATIGQAITGFGVAGSDTLGLGYWRLRPPFYGTSGDANGSGSVDIDDVVFLIGYIFGGGQPPDPDCIGDANGSDGVDIDDVVYLIAFIFRGGPAPVDIC